MKTLVVLAIIIFVVGFILYRINPGIVMVTDGTFPTVNATYEIEATSLLLNLTLVDSSENSSVTELTFPIDMVNNASMKEVPNFKPKPYDTTDGYTIEEAKLENAKTVRFIGDYVMEPNIERSIRIEFKNRDGMKGQIRGMRESKGTLGGSMSFFFVTVGDNDI